MPEKPRRGRVMRFVAIASAALVVLRLAAGGTALYGDHLLGEILRTVTFAGVAATLAYYPLHWLAATWDRLMWRVRRRLAITYLLVGLTPLLLMAAHSLVSWLGLSAEAMARVVTVQVVSSAEQALGMARSLEVDLEGLPAGTPEDRLQALLDERAALLRTALPGARAAVVAGTALPSWLAGQGAWSGLSHSAAVRTRAIESPALRAVARGGPDRPYAVLVEVPVDDQFVRHLSDVTGIRIRPVVAAGGRDRAGSTGAAPGTDAGPATDAGPPAAPAPAAAAGPVPGSGRSPGAGATGRPSAGFLYVASMPSTDWATGRRSEQALLAFDWSWAEAGRQILGSSTAGRYWRLGLIILGFVFMAFELLALGAAGWMVRAVTGTVDRLYRATEFIARGDFSHRIQVRSRDQLGELARHFNEMSAHIESLLRERVERERLVREIEIAAAVQARLFPRLTPRLETAAIVGECRAARGVAGDYYDYLEVAPGRVALALGDVAGKGLSASLLMSNLQACLRAQAAIEAERFEARPGQAAAAMGAAWPAEGGWPAAAGTADAGGAAREDRPGNGAGVARIAASVNRQLCQSSDDNRFATLFLALYDDRTRLLRYTNAGHNAPILVSRDGAVERLVPGGTVVGAFDDARYVESRARIDEDAVLLIFSDGISEARNSDDEEYGEDRLVRFAVAHRGLPAEDLCRALFAEVDSWSGPLERGDDQTLVIVKGSGAAREARA